MLENETGKFPVAIGTSLALESILGIADEQPKDIVPPITNYKELWVNIATVIRNFHGSMTVAVSGQMTYDEYVNHCISEVLTIKSVLQDRRKGFKVKFYSVDYDNILPNVFPKAKFKQPNTDRQKSVKILYDTVLAQMHSKIVHVDIDYSIYNFTMQSYSHIRSLFLTHMPVDMILFRMDNNDILLESHTGRIKQTHEWNTKLKGGKNLDRIPFNAYTLQVFGDSANTLIPADIKHRKALKKESEERQWNTSLPIKKFIKEVKSFKDSSLKSYILGLKPRIK